MKKTTPKQTVAAKAVEKPTDPMPPVLAKEDVQEEPKARFHGDPTHAQYLLSDPERKTEAIRYAAEHGYNAFIDGEHGPATAMEVNAYPPSFDDLPDVAKFGILNHVAAIVNDPHAPTYAAIMPANADRKAYRALDDALRDALGFSRYRHG